MAEAQVAEAMAAMAVAMKVRIISLFIIKTYFSNSMIFYGQ